MNVPPDCAQRPTASKTRQARCAARAEFNVSPGAALFAEMLSLANDGRYPLIELAPQDAGNERWKRSVRQRRR